MKGAAEAMAELDEGNFGRALEIIHATVALIEALEVMEDETFQYERERSLVALRDMASQIDENRPVTELESLERELRQAIETQRFEQAAHLRDRIRLLRGPSHQ